MKALALAVLALSLTSCATYRYLPGGEAADRACGAEARKATRRATPWSEVSVTVLLGEAFTAQAQADRFMAVYQPCMTERGLPPGRRCASASTNSPSLTAGGASDASVDTQNRPVVDT